MKIGIDINDNLLRRAKAEVARRGVTLDTLVEEGLKLVLNARAGAGRSARLSALVERARGMVQSGIRDLGSNKAHLKNLGRPARKH